MDEEVFLSVKQISKRYNVGVASVWRWAADDSNSFPEPVSLSRGCTRWRISDLEKWEDDV